MTIIFSNTVQMKVIKILLNKAIKIFHHKHGKISIWKKK